MKNEIILSVLEDVRKHLVGLSDDFLSLDINSPYFGDSCKLVDVRNTILRLIVALKLVIQYA